MDLSGEVKWFEETGISPTCATWKLNHPRYMLDWWVKATSHQTVMVSLHMTNIAESVQVDPVGYPAHLLADTGSSMQLCSHIWDM